MKLLLQQIGLSCSTYLAAIKEEEEGQCNRPVKIMGRSDRNDYENNSSVVCVKK